MTEPGWISGSGFIEGWPERYAGTGLDVRALIARMPPDVKDGSRRAWVPWSRFAHACGRADDVPGLLAEAGTGDAETGRRALRALWGSVCHQGDPSSAGALAVPFLVRIAVASKHARTSALGLVAELVRRQRYGVGSRARLLRAFYAPGEWAYDCSGYPANWAVEGARDAVAADARLLLPLLDDPDPEVRCEIGHALAAVPGRCGGLAAAGLRDRLGREDVPEVRASLVLGLGELAIGSGDERGAAAWARTLWSSTARPGEVRLAAALAWLCLVDGPVPAELFGALADTVTDDAALVMARVPWIRAVDDGAVGLYRCLAQMLGSDARDVLGIDVAPWPSSDPWEGLLDEQDVDA